VIVIALRLTHPPAVLGADVPPIPNGAAGSGTTPTRLQATRQSRRRAAKRVFPTGAQVPVVATPAKRAGPAPGVHGAEETSFNSCRRVPAGQRSIKANLKPDADLSELVAWISALTCRQFIVPASSSAASRKVTLVAPALMTRDEAYGVFLDALDSVGLTVEPAGKALQIIESAKAKSASIPVYGFDGRPLSEPSPALQLGRQP
jgi:type II secretory pathway component GspD/PulD (secretin)